MRKTSIMFSALCAALSFTWSCSNSEFRAEGSGPVPIPSVQPSPGEGPTTPGGIPKDGVSDFSDILGNTFPDRDIDEEQSDISKGLMVPLNISYEGENSGSDAQFTFYVARISPVKDRKEVEIIKSVRKEYITASQPTFCKCGQKNEMYFMWRHVRGRAGALHTRTEGEWMVGHDVSEDKWKTKGLKSVPTGLGTWFLGADTENPNFLFDPTGNGFFRTDSYAPNSILGNSRKWEHRDDMRLSLSCDVAACPSELQATTELELVRHASMNP